MEGDVEDRYIEQIRALKAEVAERTDLLKRRRNELNQWIEVGDQLRDIDYLKDYDVFSKIEALLAKGEQR